VPDGGHGSSKARENPSTTVTDKGYRSSRDITSDRAIMTRGPITPIQMMILSVAG
jgi:hypothetical protein